MAEQNTSINGSTEGNYSWWTPEAEERYEFFSKHEFAESLYVWIISAVEIPVLIFTLFMLCVVIKSHRSAPVFAIHLILSDLIQVICKLMLKSKWSPELFFAHLFSFLAGLYFMTCIAVERYLLVSHPIWYRSHHSLKVCCVISVIIWFVPLIFANIISYGLYFNYLPRLIACLIPYPIVILCFVGTCRGLSHVRSLTPLKRRFILGSLFLVLVAYTLLTLPFAILEFIAHISPKFWYNLLFIKCLFFSEFLLYLNPLANCILYLFMRPDVGDLLKSVSYCCRIDTHHS